MKFLPPKLAAVSDFAVYKARLQLDSELLLLLNLAENPSGC